MIRNGPYSPCISCTVGHSKKTADKLLRSKFGTAKASSKGDGSVFPSPSSCGKHLSGLRWAEIQKLCRLFFLQAFYIVLILFTCFLGYRIKQSKIGAEQLCWSGPVQANTDWTLSGRTKSATGTSCDIVWTAVTAASVSSFTGSSGQSLSIALSRFQKLVETLSGQFWLL